MTNTINYEITNIEDYVKHTFKNKVLKKINQKFSENFGIIFSLINDYVTVSHFAEDTTTIIDITIIRPETKLCNASKSISNILDNEDNEDIKDFIENTFNDYTHKLFIQLLQYYFPESDNINEAETIFKNFYFENNLDRFTKAYIKGFFTLDIANIHICLYDFC